MKPGTRTTLTIVLLLLLAGCAGSDTTRNSDAADSGTPVNGDWAIVQLEAEPDTLNPLTYASTYSGYINFGINDSNVYETLLAQEPSDWITPKGLLAEGRPEVAAGHLAYTFTVRQGVNWHDGKPLTVDDVLYSFKAVVCPGADTARMRPNLTDVSNIEVDGRKIRFTMSKPYVLNEISLGTNIAIIPKHVFDPQGALDSFTYKDLLAEKNRKNPALLEYGKTFNSNPAARAPVGTGPYKFEKWDTGKEIALVRNDQYWGVKPHLNKIVYRIILDAAAALTALKAGDVDFVPRLQAVQYAQQTSGPAFDQQFGKTPYTLTQYYYLGWNEERSYFKDKRVRQALTMLLNRQQIVDTIRFGLGQPAGSPIPPGPATHNPNVKPLPYDTNRAAALLDEAGWKDSNGDGIRDKEGKPFSFELLSSTSALSNQLSPIFKEEFRKAGIDVREKHVEFATFANSMRDHAFDAVISGASLTPLTDPYDAWHSSSIANRGTNVVSFRNPQSDELLEQARREFDMEKRKQILWKWQEIMADEQPYTILFYPQDAAAYSRRFQGVKFLPVRPGYDLHSWYVPASRQKYH